MNNDKEVRADHNFVKNGDLVDELLPWEPNDDRRVTRQAGLWEGGLVGYISAVNLGEAFQSFDLASRPSPRSGKADYELRFFFEVVAVPEGEVGRLRITPGKGGEEDLELQPSSKVERRQDPGAETDLLDLNLVERIHTLVLDCDETIVRLAVVSPDNGSTSHPGEVRVTFVQVLLKLERLLLDSLKIDGTLQDPDQPLHLCFGGSHDLVLQVNADNAWHDTFAGLLVNDSEVDPEELVSSAPMLGREHAIDQPWTLFCKAIMEDREIERTLAVRSQYTADKYLLDVVCGHFWLDVICVRKATYYPVIDLQQSVGVTVRVTSHFTQMPLAQRKVTFTLKGPGTVLLTEDTDGIGEAHLTWTPDTEGDWEIEAKVASHYHPDAAQFTFNIRVLKQDPWLSARFLLNAPLHGWIWGAQTAHLNRGDDHEVTVAFADGHRLADSGLMMHWEGEDTPEGLGATIVPKIGYEQPVQENGASCRLAFENRRNSTFELYFSCSKLLVSSPMQMVNLGHYSLTINNPRQSSRFPAVGGPDLTLSVDVRSTVPGVGAVSGVPAYWKIGDGPETELSTGVEGRVQFPFRPVEEGSFVVSVRVGSPYDAGDPSHKFNVFVLGENPWAKLATVTLDGRTEGQIGHICFRDSPDVELSIMPVEGRLIGEFLTVELANESGVDLKFEVHPDPTISRRMTSEGLRYQVRSDSPISSHFQLIVHHEDLDPNAQQGRLLSCKLQEEGALMVDDIELGFGETLYACFGAEHQCTFTPGAESPITGLMLSAKLEEGDDLNLKLTPDTPQEFVNVGVPWKLDAKSSTTGGDQGVVFGLPQANFDFPLQTVSVGDHRIVITARGPTADLQVGESDFLDIHAKSFYTGRAVPGLAVTFENGFDSKSVPTVPSGWARFLFMAEEPGDFQVKATPPSPYDETPPFHVFEVKVLSLSKTLPEEE